MTNLIIKTSYSKIPNGTLKSNFGDLVRSTILLDCINKDFLWLTDERSASLLKYFISPKKLFLFEKDNLPKNSFSKIYNIDNYIFDDTTFGKINGNWEGYPYKTKEIHPKNSKIDLIAPYTFQKIKTSWQQIFIEGMGFSWEEQDFAWPRMNIRENIDIGLNWNIHPQWTAKHWAKENWEKLYALLNQKYSVSWQQGLDNFNDYMNWMALCRIIITGETLGKHLASALRKKVVALVGPAESNEFSYGRIIEIKPPPRECMPCNSPTCRFQNSCLNEITPEEVFKTISELL